MAASMEKGETVHHCEIEGVDACSGPQERLRKLQTEHGTTWDGPNDPRDPYNWSFTRKVSIAVVLSTGQLVTIMSASIMAPSLIQIAEELGMSSTTSQISFSIYMLGLALAPFLIAALSEMYGRKPVWVVFNMWYLLWNTLCPVGRSSAVMVVARFFTGTGAAAGITLTGPVMADMYRAEHRGKSLALATFIPYLGPALGPIIGGLVSQNVSWPWLFWILSIADAILTVVGIFLLKESYTPILLQRKRASEYHLESIKVSLWSRAFYQDLASRLSAGLLRPLVLMIKSPVIQIISPTLALEFGIYCLMLSTFASLWIGRYGESETISSLNYISIAIGSTVAAQGGGILMDFIYRCLRDRANGKATPEFRVPYMVPTIVLIPVGLFWYGWSAEGNISWIMVDLGAAIFTLGSFMLSQGLLAYLLDEFTHAASANAAARVLSNIFGFVFPIFAPAMYKRLGYGWGNSVLALVFVVLGTPVPLIFWIWGPRLRKYGRS